MVELQDGNSTSSNQYKLVVLAPNTNRQDLTFNVTLRRPPMQHETIKLQRTKGQEYYLQVSFVIDTTIYAEVLAPLVATEIE